MSHPRETTKIEPTGERPAAGRHVARNVAVLAGAAAAGYGAYRLISNRRANARSADAELQTWLDSGLTDLGLVLELGKEELDWLQHEVGGTAELVIKLLRRTRLVKPALRARIELAMEERFLLLKKRVFKKLSIRKAPHEQALHSFFEAIRERIFPSVVVRLDGEIMTS